MTNSFDVGYLSTDPRSEVAQGTILAGITVVADSDLTAAGYAKFPEVRHSQVLSIADKGPFSLDGILGEELIGRVKDGAGVAVLDKEDKCSFEGLVRTRADVPSHAVAQQYEYTLENPRRTEADSFPKDGN